MLCPAASSFCSTFGAFSRNACSVFAPASASFCCDFSSALSSFWPTVRLSGGAVATREGRGRDGGDQRRTQGRILHGVLRWMEYGTHPS
jgi:hypothetical protein